MPGDVFSGRLFSARSLTNSINTLPYIPRLLGEFGWFTEKPITTTLAYIVRKDGKISVLQTANRGTMENVRTTTPRRGFPIEVPHVPQFQNIIADDIQNVLADTSDERLKTMAEHINEQMLGMKMNHDVTHEFHRMGALKGIVLDADLSVIVNLFTLFGITQQQVNLVSTATDLDPFITEVKRTIAEALGNQLFTSIVAFCGNEYFDAVIQHETMREGWKRWNDGGWRRKSHLGPAWEKGAANGFEYQNVLWINYRPETFDDLEFLPSDEAYYVPMGIPQLFEDIIAPADMEDFVNKKGRRFYASQERMPHGKGRQLHTQSNVLSICKRPEAIVKSVVSETSSSSSA